MSYAYVCVVSCEYMTRAEAGEVVKWPTCLLGGVLQGQQDSPQQISKKQSGLQLVDSSCSMGCAYDGSHVQLRTRACSNVPMRQHILKHTQHHQQQHNVTATSTTSPCNPPPPGRS
jgi:hypothetical protein